MLYHDKTTGQIHICCIALLTYLSKHKIEILGILLDYPNLKDMETGFNFVYCPFCGSKLKQDE
jgi:hypothetical protein